MFSVPETVTLPFFVGPTEKFHRPEEFSSPARKFLFTGSKSSLHRVEEFSSPARKSEPISRENEQWPALAIHPKNSSQRGTVKEEQCGGRIPNSLGRKRFFDAITAGFSAVINPNQHNFRIYIDNYNVIKP